MPPHFQPNEVKFQRHVRRSPGCWLWEGARAPNGYGVGSYDKRIVSAHRISWMLHRGEIPDGLCVLHKCDVRNCVNPDHLFLGTCKDNTRDSMSKNRNVKGERQHASKLRTQHIREIFRLRHVDKWKLKQIADRFAVTEQAIWCVIHGKSWAHVRMSDSRS